MEKGSSGHSRQRTPQRSGLAGLRRVTGFFIFLVVLLFVYSVIADRTTPYSGDGRVQAFVLRVAPEITGRVDRVPVTDNAFVEAGSELFRIEPTPFEIAVDQAEANLARVGQTLGASTAAVEAAQARLDEARATEANVLAQTARVLELVQRGVYAQARADDAQATIDEARAGVEAAEAELQRARQELGPEGENNPQIKEAIAALERARFDLSRTTVVAASDGVVTNLQLAGGQTVVAGQPAMTFISAEDVWLLASFRENSMSVIEAGHPAEIVLDALPGEVFPATVQSIGWGIASGTTDPATGLPKSGGEVDWLTDPQRFPVTLVFNEDNLPRGARLGSKASVVVYTGEDAIMDMIARFRIRLISYLTYLS